MPGHLIREHIFRVTSTPGNPSMFIRTFDDAGITTATPATRKQRSPNQPRNLGVLDFSKLDDAAYVRQRDIVRDPQHPERAVLLPFSASTLWRYVNGGKFPQPLKLSDRVTVWRWGDIRAWLAGDKTALLVGMAA